MKIFVRTATIGSTETVIEVIETDTLKNLRARYHSDFVQQLVEVTGLDPAPQQWWIRQDGAFRAPGATNT